MKLWSLLLIFSVSALASAPKKETRWDKLMRLVGQEMKLLESAKKKGAEIKYRMLELHSERLKLIHEKNNKEFIKFTKVSKSGKNKESFFKETRNYYDLTKRFGLNILKTEKRSDREAEVLFTLALNSRDYGKDNITEEYLLKVISIVQDSKNSLRHHAQTALADYYYNEKHYPQAIKYYEEVIQNKDDAWMTKHLFNLSWCYLKNRQFEAAIETIKKSYFESKNPLYVNIKDQVLENIGSFYVYAGRPLNGLDFYLNNEQNPLFYLLPMATKTSQKGHERETKVILDAAQKIVDKSELYEHQEELFHAYLDFYRHYSRFQNHEKVSSNLVTYYKNADEDRKDAKESKLRVDFKEDAIEKMRTLAGFLQIKLAKDVKKGESNFNKDDLDLVLNYFSHLSFLDPGRKVEYLYFTAETYYSVHEYKRAADSYVEAVTQARKANQLDLARKSLHSMLALTGLEVLPKDMNKNYLIFTYNQYIRFWPRDEKSQKIYPKLFEIYRKDLNDEKATQVIRVYHKAYPEHLKEQQILMTKILDQFIEKKNTIKLAGWVEEFKKGFLAFSKETIEKTEFVLGNILFIQYQELAKKGERLAAAKGFENLYVHKLYPNKVKSQAAFFAAMAYLELGATKKAYYWQELAHARMTEKEKLERREEQLRMTERTYRLQDFSTALMASEFLLKKYCSLKDDVQNRFYEIAVMTSLVEDRPSEAERVVNEYSKCLKNPETKDTGLAQIYQFHEKQGDFFQLRRFVGRHPEEPYITQYRFSLQKWYWEKTDINLKHLIKKEFKDMKHPETLAWLKEINLFKKALKEREFFMAEIIWNRPKFDTDAYNKALEGYLLKLKNFKDKYQELTQSNQLDLAILSTKLFSELYAHAGQLIQGIRPQGMTPETFKHFSAAMKDLSKQFISGSRQYADKLNSALKDKESLTWGSRSIASIEEVENPVFSFFTGLTMDTFKE